MQEDNYRLEIKANKNSSASEILQEIQIKVHSEQKIRRYLSEKKKTKSKQNNNYFNSNI